jgi:penicillin amidase
MFEYYRNRRINERLAAMNNITVEDMMQLQNDNMNIQASECIPLFMQYLEKDKLSATEKTYLAEVEKWNYLNEAGSIAAAIFEEWFYKTDSLTWDELMVAGEMTEAPQEYNLYLLMKHYPEHELFDDRRTPDKTESLRTLVNTGFRLTCTSLDKWKTNHSKPLTWSNYKSTSIQHLSRLPAFSVNHIETGGNRKIVNAISSRWGPSWRMIVSLEDPVKAYGVYPGGQSGNPGSPYYTTGVEKWSKGEYFELLFMKTAADTDSRIRFKQTLTN